MRTVRGTIWLVLLTILALHMPMHAFAQTNTQCNDWDGYTSQEEQRLELIKVTASSGTACQGAFRLENKTQWHNIGGYTLHLRVRAENAEVVLAPVIPGLPAAESYLHPDLDIEIHAIPTAQRAQVTIEGEMDLKGLTIDTALFLIETLLSLGPPGTDCLVPKSQIYLLAVRLSGILGSTTALALDGDFIGAADALRQVIDEFASRLEDALTDIGLDCASDVVKLVVGKVGALLKLIPMYLAWIPRVFWDYFKYEGRPVVVTLEYIGAPAMLLIERPEYPVLDPGTAHDIGFTVQNTGPQEWTPETVQLNRTTPAALGAARPGLPQVVPPGGQVRWILRIKAPALPGAYTETWQQTYRGRPFGEPMHVVAVVVPEGSSGDLRLALEGMLADARQRLNEQFDTAWENLRRRIEERIREEIMKEVRRQLAPLCGTVPAGLIFATALVWRRRRRRQP